MIACSMNVSVTHRAASSQTCSPGHMLPRTVSVVGTRIVAAQAEIRNMPSMASQGDMNTTTSRRRPGLLMARTAVPPSSNSSSSSGQGPEGSPTAGGQSAADADQEDEVGVWTHDGGGGFYWACRALIITP